MKKINKPQNKTVAIAAVAILIIIVLGLLIHYLFFNQPFLFAGTLEATKVDLSARLSAAIDEVRVHEGYQVTEGDVLITFVCEDFKVASKLAQDNYERSMKLVKGNFVTPESIDTLKTQMHDAAIKVDWCTLSSPIDGRVLTRYHEPGEWMTPGIKVLTLANIKDIWAYIYVPQPMVANLSYGMPLKAIVPELNNRVFMGRIIKINDEAEFTPKNVQTQSERERLIYGVKVSFLESNQDEILKPGMTVEVELPNKMQDKRDKKQDEYDKTD